MRKLFKTTPLSSISFSLSPPTTHAPPHSTSSSSASSTTMPRVARYYDAELARRSRVRPRPGAMHATTRRRHDAGAPRRGGSPPMKRGDHDRREAPRRADREGRGRGRSGGCGADEPTQPRSREGAGHGGPRRGMCTPDPRTGDTHQAGGALPRRIREGAQVCLPSAASPDFSPRAHAALLVDFLTTALGFSGLFAGM